MFVGGNPSRFLEKGISSKPISNIIQKLFIREGTSDNISPVCSFFLYFRMLRFRNFLKIVQLVSSLRHIKNLLVLKVYHFRI